MLLLMLLESERQGCACSQRELAGRMRLAPATVAVSLKSLERQGYVERSTDDRDARRNLVRLTEKGREAVEVCGQVFRSVDERGAGAAHQLLSPDDEKPGRRAGASAVPAASRLWRSAPNF